MPGDIISQTYDLEYGTDTIEMQSDSIKQGQSVLIVDDLLATGGTMAASIELCKKFNAVILGCCVIIELTFLNARKMIENNIYSLECYDE